MKRITPMDVAKDISEGFARNVISANLMMKQLKHRPH